MGGAHGWRDRLRENTPVQISLCTSLKLRRRRSLISAQRLERSDNLGNRAHKTPKTLKGFARQANPFRVEYKLH
jgi:hypothetical protein